MGHRQRLRPRAQGRTQGKLIQAVAAFYWRLPTKQEAAAFGLIPEDYESDRPTLALWPEHVEPFLLFARLQTQWRTSATGVIGMDYNVVLHELDRMSLDRDTYDDYFDAFRVLEFAAVKHINKD